MTLKEALEISRKRLKGYLGIPQMDPEEAKRLMNMSTAVLISRKREKKTKKN